MNLPLLSVVALLADVPEQGLTRGQIGTVVELLRRGDEEALLVEFSDDNGQTYAPAILKPEQLMPIHRRHEAA
jgi:hypothetical protein